MNLSQIEGKLILALEVITLHLGAALSKMYLWRNKESKKELVLLEEMTGIEPVIFPNVNPSVKNDTLIFGYLVRGTSIILRPACSDYDPHKKGKYDIMIGLTVPPWERKVDLEYILDNYPDRVKQHFLFNLTKFN